MLLYCITMCLGWYFKDRRLDNDRLSAGKEARLLDQIFVKSVGLTLRDQNDNLIHTTRIAPKIGKVWVLLGANI